MAVLVTGAAGFIGSAVAEALARRGYEVVGLDNYDPYYSPELKHARVSRVQAASSTGFRMIEADFARFDDLRQSLEDIAVERIVHLGAQPGVRYSIENPHAYVQANVVGHLNVLELARARDVAHLVYASSSSVYGSTDKVPFAVEDKASHPRSLYAATKKAGELMSESYANLYRLPQTGLRFFTVYGPWGRPDMMPWIFTERILKGNTVPVFNRGRMLRDFTYVDDVVEGVIACLEAPPIDDGSAKPGGSEAPHAIYNIGNNKPETLLDVIRIIERACEREAALELLPMQAGDVPRTCADIDAIARDMNFRPSVSAAEGFPRFVRWFRDYTRL